VEFVEAPVPRPLAALSGDLDQLLRDPDHTWAEGAWVQAVLTDAARPQEAMARLQRRFPHAVSLQFAPKGGPARASRRSVIGRSDHDVALDFLAAVRGRPATEAESTLLREAVDACCDDPDADVQVSA
jgi:exonuclease SbcD